MLTVTQPPSRGTGGTQTTSASKAHGVLVQKANSRPRPDLKTTSLGGTQDSAFEYLSSDSCAQRLEEP